MWDIAGKWQQLSVGDLIGRQRAVCAAYYNSSGGSVADAVADSRRAVEAGFNAAKDHFPNGAEENMRWFAAVRDAVGAEVTLMHDAAENSYSYDEAVEVGRALQDNGFLWFEEPLSDRDFVGLKRLCGALELAILAPETLHA